MNEVNDEMTEMKNKNNMNVYACYTSLSLQSWKYKTNKLTEKTEKKFIIECYNV